MSRASIRRSLYYMEVVTIIDINEFTIDRKKERRKIKCIMIDEYDNSKGRGILVMDSI